MAAPRTVSLEHILNQEAGIVVAQHPTLPFEVKRVYWFYQVPEGQTRGHHAHKTVQKILVCTQGQVDVRLETPTGQVYRFTLDKPYEGLYVPPLFWGTYKFHKGATMICLASEIYQEKDYIRDYAAFKTGYGN